MNHFVKVNGHLVQLEQPEKYRELDTEEDISGRVTAILGGVVISLILVAVIILGLCF